MTAIAVVQERRVRRIGRLNRLGLLIEAAERLEPRGDWGDGSEGAEEAEARRIVAEVAETTDFVKGIFPAWLKALRRRIIEQERMGRPVDLAERLRLFNQASDLHQRIGLLRRA